MSIDIPRRPDRIDATLLRVRTDLVHTPPSVAPDLRVKRTDMRDILEYVRWLENEIEGLEQDKRDLEADIEFANTAND